MSAPFDSVHHDGSGRYVVAAVPARGEALALGDEVWLRVRSGLDAPVDRVLVRTTPDGEQAFTELRVTRTTPVARWWETVVPLRMPVTGYRFLLLGDAGPRWLNGTGIHTEAPTDHGDFRLVAGYASPAWLRDAVVYQVFPDRFANGDPANDVGDDAWVYRGQPTRRGTWGVPPAEGPAGMTEFYGGDLAGIEQRLDHLEGLGVNTIYLTPIFEARSNHGYDTIDYLAVADHLGGDAALVSLRRATAERGMRLIMDIAPNHTGVEHPWFAAAQADAAAQTAGWYTFHRHPDEYESWLGVRSLPKLDYRSDGLRRAMYEGPDAILRHWLREPFAIDGWRVDVANMLGRMGPVQVGREVARGIRAAVKAENPEAYLLGEHFFDASETLNGDEWDGVMNYAGFANPVHHWLAEELLLAAHGTGEVARLPPTSTADLVKTLTAFRASAPWALARNQYDLLGSHDTPRIRTLLGGDDGRLRAAFGLLLTDVGVPGMFYGDEVGLEGVDGQAARATMPWDERAWDHGLLEHVRTLARFRRGSRALRDGGHQVLEVRPESFSFLRDVDEEQVVVVVVRGPAARPDEPLRVAHGAIPDGTSFESVLTGATAVVEAGHLRIGPTAAGVAAWVARTAEGGAA
jgi:alpha-glucosidase